MKLPIRIESVNKHPIAIPQYATVGSSGFDIEAYCEHGPIEIHPGERVKISTNLRFIIPAGYEIQIRARSGLAIKHGIALINGVGTIDADYRGELGLLMINHGTETFTITDGMKIAQGVVAAVIQARFEMIVETDNKDTIEDYKTARGEGGFGSTGC